MTASNTDFTTSTALAPDIDRAEIERFVIALAGGLDEPIHWRAIHDAVSAADPLVNGILILGMDSSIEELERSFLVSADCPAVRGFAVGRPIVGSAYTEWINGRINAEGAQSLIADRFRRVIAAWRSSRPSHREYGA